MDDRAVERTHRLADRFMTIGLIVFGVAAGTVAISLVVPVTSSSGITGAEGKTALEKLPEVGVDLDPLVQKMAGVRLIKPPQVQAAVKDTGAAAQLVKKLALQGVVRIGDDFVAYIQVDKGGVTTVRQGRQVLGFVGEKVEPGRVTLSLQGVQVVLEH